MPTTSPIEIFRPGAHTAMSGEALAFSADDLAATAAAYDPSLHEAPIVVGHPRHDAPAYGWVGTLAVQEGALAATPVQVDPAFAELVGAGRFKKVSASFYRPDAPGNPKPGVWYLRHVGFLGAQPPAVKGLRPVAFSDSDEDTVTVDLAEPGDLSWAIRIIAEALRGLRDRLVEQDGAEKADAVLPSWRLEDLVQIAGRIQPPVTPAFSEAINLEPKLMPDPDRSALDDERRQLDEDRQRFAAEQAAFAEARRAARRADHEGFVDRLVAEGRIAPGLKPGLVAFMDRLDADQAVAFGEGQAEQTPLAWFRGLLAQSGKIVEFGEAAPAGDEPVEFADPGEIAAAAIAYQTEQSAKGVEVSTAVAVRAVMKKRKA